MCILWLGHGGFFRDFFFNQLGFSQGVCVLKQIPHKGATLLIFITKHDAKLVSLGRNKLTNEQKAKYFIPAFINE